MAALSAHPSAAATAGGAVRGGGQGGGQEVLTFHTERFDAVRDGAVTLEWNDISSVGHGGLTYSVIAADGSRYYEGSLPKAFISGLADGSYRFTVSAINNRGELIAVSLREAEVTVNHWPLRYALMLLIVGGCVMASVIGVIAAGARASWRAGSDGPEPAGAPPLS